MRRSLFGIALLSCVLLLVLTAGCQKESPATPPQKAPEEPAAPPAEQRETEPAAAEAMEPDAPVTLAEPFEQARKNAQTAGRGFDAASRFLSAWLSHRDEATGLVPQYLQEVEGAEEGDPQAMPNVWTPANNGADLFPYLGIAAYLTDSAVYDGAIREILAAEKKLTSTDGGLPDAYVLDAKKKFGNDRHAMIAGAAEYVKDGLVPLYELTGDAVWLDRAKELTGAIFAKANIGTPHGILPSAHAGVNGNVMQSLFRLFYATGDAKYVELAQRFGDAYFLLVLPNNGGLPSVSWDFANGKPYDAALPLGDHGGEVVLGLALTYAMLNEQNGEVAAGWRPAFEQMLDTIAEKGRTENGFFVSAIETPGGSVIDGAPAPNWASVLSAFYIHSLIHGEGKYVDIPYALLKNLPKMKAASWGPSVDGLADAIAGAVIFQNRVKADPVTDFLKAAYSELLTRQGETGTIENTYQDGSFARSAMLVALMKTAGVRPEPWRPELRVGAVNRDGVLSIAAWSDGDYRGKLRFDSPRWKDTLHLPLNVPRDNEWPVWWAAEQDETYAVEDLDVNGNVVSRVTMNAASLRDGVPLDLVYGQIRLIRVSLETGPSEPVAQPEEEGAGD